MAVGHSRRRITSCTSVALACLLVTTAVRAEEALGIEGETLDFVRDASGTLHVIWTQGGGDSAVAFYGRLQIASRQVTDQVELGSGIDRSYGRPLLGVSPSGQHVQTVWGRTYGSSDDDKYDRVELAERQSDGSWTISTVHEEGYPWRYTQPAVAVRDDGSSHVAFQRWGFGQDEFVVITSRSGAGHDFSPWQQVSGNNARDVAMAVDANNGLHLRYSRAYRYAASPAGLGDVDDLDMPKHAGSADGPFFGDIFIDSQTAHLVFDDCVDCGDPGTHSIGHTTIALGAGVFSEPTRASGEPFSSADPWPAVGVDPSGRVFVMWGPSDGQCKVSILSGGSWAEHTLDSEAGMSRANKPAIVVDGQTVYGFWRKSNGSIVMENLSALAGPVQEDAGSEAPPADSSVDATIDQRATDGSRDGGNATGTDGALGEDGSSDAAWTSPGAKGADDEGCSCRMGVADDRQQWWMMAGMLGVVAMGRIRRAQPMANKHQPPRRARG